MDFPICVLPLCQDIWPGLYQKSKRHIKDMLFHLRLQIALERIAAPLTDYIHLLQFRQRFDAQPTLIAKLVVGSAQIIE